MRYSLPVLLWFLALTAPALADGEPAPAAHPLETRVVAEVREMIRSKGGISSSWGAYYAGKYRLAGLTEDLIDLIARENGRPENGTPIVRKAALDALVRLGAAAPAELLVERLDAISLPETLILLAQDPAANRDALLALMDAPPAKGEHRWAAAVLLAPSRPEGLARRLLADVRMRLDVTVRDAGADDLIRTGFGIGGGRWGSTSAIFPPRATYSFHLHPTPGCVVLAAGSLPLYYRRTEGARSGRSEPKTSPYRRSEIALLCLGTMLDRDLAEMSESRILAHDWTDAERLRIAVDGERQLLVSLWANLVDELCGAGLLGRGEAPLEPEIDVRIHDRRSEKAPPLDD